MQLRPAAPPPYARAVLAAGAFAAVTLAWFAWAARFPVPYRDDWDWLLWIFQGPLTLTRYFEPHNEHMIPLPRLLVVLQYRLQGANGTVLWWVSLTSQALGVAILTREVLRRFEGDGEARALAGGLSLLILSFSYQLQSLVFAGAIVFPLLLALAVAAVVAMVNAAEHPPRSAARVVWLAASVAATIGTMCTSSNGLILPLVLAIAAVALRLPWTVAGVELLLTAGGALLFTRLVLGTSAARASGAIAPAEHLPAIAGYFLAFFAPSMTYGSTAIGALSGLAGVIAAALLLVRAWRQGPSLPRVERVSAPLLLFVLGTSAMAAAGRAQFGLEQAAQSRYATFAQLYWALLLVAGASWWDQRGYRVQLRGRALRGILLLGAAAVLVAHMFTGVVWIAKTGNIRAAGLALAADSRDEEWIVTLHPLTDVIHKALAASRADGDRTIISPWIDTVPQITDLQPCRADLSVIVSSPLRVAGVVEEPLANGLLAGADGRVIGLAAPAPLVSAPNASRSAVTGAVIAAIRNGAPRGGTAWMGFGNAAARPPLTFIGLDASQRLRCRAEVVSP